MSRKSRKPGSNKLPQDLNIDETTQIIDINSSLSILATAGEIDSAQNTPVPSPQRAVPTSPTRIATLRPGGVGTCRCKNTECLKLYCVCFAAGNYCTAACTCKSCSNKKEFNEKREAAIAQVLGRNPLAFRPKVLPIPGASSTHDSPFRAVSGSSLAITVSKSQGIIGNHHGDPSVQTYHHHQQHNNHPMASAEKQHVKGCHCKNSKCLKKYCVCFQAGVHCSALCKCQICKNFDGSLPLHEIRMAELQEINHQRTLMNLEPIGVGVAEVVARVGAKRALEDFSKKEPITQGSGVVGEATSGQYNDGKGSKAVQKWPRLEGENGEGYARISGLAQLSQAVIMNTESENRNKSVLSHWNKLGGSDIPTSSNNPGNKDNLSNPSSSAVLTSMKSIVRAFHEKRNTQVPLFLEEIDQDCKVLIQVASEGYQNYKKDEKKSNAGLYEMIEREILQETLNRLKAIANET